MDTITVEEAAKKILQMPVPTSQELGLTSVTDKALRRIVDKVLEVCPACGCSIVVKQYGLNGTIEVTRFS